MFKIYKSLTPIDINNPPEPIAINISETSYIDMDVVLGDRFYYRVSATQDGIEKFSDQIVGIAGEIDEYFSQVELLIFADAETFPSVTFIDSSSFARTVTYAGNAKIVSPAVFNPKYDDGTIYIPGSGGRVDVSLPAFNLDDFTIECHEALLSTQGNSRTLWQFGTTAGGIKVSVDSSRRLWLEGFMSWTFIGLVIGGSLGLNSWSHICIERKNGVFYLMVDGVLIGSNANYTTTNIPAGVFSVGNIPSLLSTSSSWDGYISGLRITKGVARYEITGFTPPTSKYPH